MLEGNFLCNLLIMLTAEEITRTYVDKEAEKKEKQRQFASKTRHEI